jgi:predicted DNA-binding WGR domain protein
VYQARGPAPGENGEFPGVSTNAAGANRRRVIQFPVNSAQARNHAMAEPIQLPLFPDQAALTRIRPERNEWRFYRLAVWPDLFGRALLARQWGRIGTQGRVRLDPHAGAAINVLARLVRAKRRRGYRDSPA